MSVKITDLVDQEAIDKLHELDSELAKVLETYKKVAQDLAKGLNINVSCIGDIDKLEQILAVKGKEAAQVQQQLTSVIGEQQKVIANTTNTISRQLMEQEKVNKTQRDAYTEYERVKNLLAQVNGTYENNVKSLLRVNEAIAANKKQQEELKKQYESGRIGAEQYNEALLQLTIRERELKQEKANLTTLLKNEERENQAVVGSYNQMSQQLELLKKAYKSMTQEEKQSSLGKEIESTIQNLDAHLKDLAADMGEFQRNVGNYAVAGGSVKKELKELVLEIANLSIAYQSLSAEEKKSADGQALASHIQDLTEKAGVLKDAIADTNQAITNAASDTRGFDQLSGSIQLAIDGFGLATGAAEMLGISSEDLATIQTKLQAAIAASNAMQSIQNTLQAQSAVMQGVNLVQTRLRTVAENLHTAAKGKGVIATVALTAAQWAFNAAANANPIGLIVVAIIACIAAVWGLVKAFAAFFGTSEEDIKQYEKQKEAFEEMSKAHDEEIERLKARGATQAELKNAELNNKQEELEAAEALFTRASELYDDDEDEYTEALENKKKAQEDYEKFQTDSLNYLNSVIHEAEEKEKEERLGTYEYKRQMILAELEQQKALALTLLNQEKITRQVYENMVKALDKAANMKIDDINKKEQESSKKNSKQRTNNAKKAADELKKEVQKGEDALLNIITDSLERQRRAENLSYRRKLADLEKQLSTELAKRKQNVRLIEALQNQIKGLNAEHSTKLEDIEISSMQRRQKAREDFISLHLEAVKKGGKEEYNLKKEQLQNQRDMEYTEIDLAERKHTITAEQALEMRAMLVEKYANLETELAEDHAAEMAEITMKKYADQQANDDNAYVEQLNALKNKYVEEMRLAEGNAAKQAAIKARFDEDQAKLSEDYAVQTARNSVAMLEKVLKTENLSAEERKKYEAELVKAKGALEAAMADRAIAEIDRINQADAASKEKRMQNAQQWMQVAADSLSAINDLVGTIYDAKISKVEEEQEVNQAAADAEQERISELVEKKVITEEEGEARKRAAEAKTAKKNEELEKKKAKLKREQAIWDKANNIAQCTMQTALAIMNAWATAPWPINIAMAAVAGAMGALQLATIIATPLPKYAKGTKSHKGGPAVVGDGGEPELVTFGGKSWITPDTPTIVDLPAGAAVIPHISGVDDSLVSIPTSSNDSKTPVIINNDYSRLEAKMDNFIYLIKQQTKQQRQIASNAALQRISDRL